MNGDNHLLNMLTRAGVLINVSVRFWRGCKKLKPEDIGLNHDQISDRLISLGHKRLLPKEATAVLTLVEGRAHALVEANTFPFLNGLGHFLPNGRLEEVTGKLKTLEQEFWNAKQQFVNQYGSLRAQASEEWRRMVDKLSSDPDRVLATIEDSFPAVGQMERFFGFDLQMFQITLPERLSIDLVSAAQQQEVVAARQRAALEAAAKIRRDTESFVSDCVAALREQTATLCHEMLQSISTSETGVHQKTLNRLVRFIEQFKQMNFANDSEMDAQLERVRHELLHRTAEEYRNSEFAREQLVHGLEALRTRATALAREDASHLVQRFGELGRRKFNLAA